MHFRSQSFARTLKKRMVQSKFKKNKRKMFVTLDPFLVIIFCAASDSAPTTRSSSSKLNYSAHNRTYLTLLQIYLISMKCHKVNQNALLHMMKLPVEMLNAKASVVATNVMILNRIK